MGVSASQTELGKVGICPAGAGGASKPGWGGCLRREGPRCVTARATRAGASACARCWLEGAPTGRPGVGAAAAARET